MARLPPEAAAVQVAAVVGEKGEERAGEVGGRRTADPKYCRL